jgi:hypothetical protein
MCPSSDVDERSSHAGSATDESAPTPIGALDLASCAARRVARAGLAPALLAVVSNLSNLELEQEEP